MTDYICKLLKLLDQFSYLGNRARYEFIELDLSTGLDKQIGSGISLVIWATELDTSLSSSICQPASINVYCALPPAPPPQRKSSGSVPETLVE